MSRRSLGEGRTAVVPRHQVRELGIGQPADAYPAGTTDSSGRAVIYLIHWGVVLQSSIVVRVTLRLIVSALVCFFSLAGNAQNITANGNFETGPFDSNGNVTNWATGGSSQIAVTTEGATDGTHSATFNVGGDTAGGTLSQNLTTTSGQWYVLDFDSGIFGQRTGTPLQLSIQVSGASALVTYAITPPETHTPITFHHYHFAFVADSATTTLQFSDVGLGNGSADTLLDAVSVQPTPGPTAGPIPIVNGNFETSPYDVNGTITGWTVGGSGDLAASAEGATSGTHSAAFSGGHDSQSNTLSQTFATTPGQSYNVDFDAGVFGMHSVGPLQFRVRVFDSATAVSLLNQTVVPPEAGTSSPNAVVFNHYQFVFNASGTATTLEFADIGTGAGSADVVLDSVSVAIPTPTPLPTATPSPTPTPTATPTPTPTTLPLNNGSFETPPYFQVGTVAGWTVSGNMNVGVTTQGATDGTHSASLSAGADSQNDILSQSFVTSVGQTYSLDFDAGIAGMTESTLHLQIQVLGTGTLFSQLVAPPYNPSQVQFAHYHYTFTADGSAATLQFQDFLLGNADADILVDKVSIVALPPTYTQWRNAHFTSGQQSDPNISGWSADPDHDGFANGLEYFSNTDPMAGVRTQDSAALPRTTIESSGGSSYLTFTFRRLIGWSGNQAVIAVSDNLSTWDTTGTQTESVGAPVATGDGVTETVKVRFKTSLNEGLRRKFVRLQLSQ